MTTLPLVKKNHNQSKQAGAKLCNSHLTFCRVLYRVSTKTVPTFVFWISRLPKGLEIPYWTFPVDFRNIQCFIIWGNMEWDKTLVSNVKLHLDLKFWLKHHKVKFIFAPLTKLKFLIKKNENSYQQYFSTLIFLDPQFFGIIY